MADYLQSEFLSRLPSAMVSFLTRTALLDRVSAPVCDAMLGATGSAQVLEALESSNLLLVPLDSRREWYRYHHLFRELLSAELRRAEPALVPELHVRAAAWFEGHGMAETAIDHAQAADDRDTGRPSGRQPGPTYLRRRPGRHRPPLVQLVRGARADRAVPPSRRPRRGGGGLAGAPGTGGALGRRGRAGAVRERALPDGSLLDGWLAYLRALLCRDGVGQMRADAVGRPGPARSG